MNTIIEQIEETFSGFDFPISGECSEKLAGYYELLVSWNEKMNLTSITELDEVILKHFIDSAFLLFSPDSIFWNSKYDAELEENYSGDEFLDELRDAEDEEICQCFDLIGKSGLRIMDVGTGAGFPGVVLAILNPDWDVTLLEPLQKRVDFLETVVQELGLTGVKVVRGRAEELAHDPEHRGQYDIVVSRAVAELRVLLELGMGFVKPDGHFVAYKGPRYEEEIEASEHASSELCCYRSGVFEYEIDEEQVRRLVIYSLLSPVPDKYPRRNGIPSKRPL